MALMEYIKSHDSLSPIPLFKLFTFGYSGQFPAEKFSEIKRGHLHDPGRGCRGNESSRIGNKQKALSVYPMPSALATRAELFWCSGGDSRYQIDDAPAVGLVFAYCGVESGPLCSYFRTTAELLGKSIFCQSSHLSINHEMRGCKAEFSRSLSHVTLHSISVKIGDGGE